jgi:hypothetical protein
VRGVGEVNQKIIYLSTIYFDSSKGVIADSRHRALTHTAWFLSVILERVFGVTITNSEGRKISVREVGEQHILEDFRMRFIPSAQDYLQEIEFKEWMMSGKGTPPSFAKLHTKTQNKIRTEWSFD